MLLLHNTKSKQNHHKKQFTLGSLTSEANPFSDRVSNPFAHRVPTSSRMQSHRERSDQSEDVDMYDLCFVVGEVEFLTFRQGFMLHSPYLRDLLANLVTSN